MVKAPLSEGVGAVTLAFRDRLGAGQPQMGKRFEMQKVQSDLTDSAGEQSVSDLSDWISDRPSFPLLAEIASIRVCIGVFPKAPPPLMAPVLIVTFQPFIEIGQELIMSGTDLLAECNMAELIEDCPRKRCRNCFRLRARRFCP